MESDRAHRSLNTILLVFILAVSTVNNQPFTGVWQHVYTIGVYGAMIAMVVLMLKIAAQNLGQIESYLGLSEA